MSLGGWGQRILQARLDLAQRRGRTVPQTEVAEAVGVSSVTLGYWEKERTEPGDVLTWKRLAKALETTPGYLAFGEKTEVRVYREVPEPQEGTAPAVSREPPRKAGGVKRRR